MKITDSKSSHFIELDKQMALLAAIQEHAAHALISTTEEGVITSFNPAAEKMLGYKADELVGKETPGVFHDLEEVVARSEQFSKKLGIAVQPGFGTFVCHCDLGLENQFEWTYVHKDGTKFPVFLSITALFDGEQNKTGYLGIAQDISNIRKIENQLRRSNEELAQFAYRTSHDLKAPLLTIKGLASFIEDDLEAGDLEEIKKNTREVFRHASKLEKLVVDILSLAKADLEAHACAKVDLGELLEDLKKSYDELLRKEKVVFSYETGVSSSVYSQEARLKQILGNLILNSIKYSDRTKKERFVKVVCDVGDNIAISVTDNGVGIPVEKQNQLFDMFTRFHTDLSEGSGLGMSIVRKNIEALKGSISFSSSAEGTQFKITLPNTNPSSNE